MEALYSKTWISFWKIVKIWNLSRIWGKWPATCTTSSDQFSSSSCILSKTKTTVLLKWLVSHHSNHREVLDTLLDPHSQGHHFRGRRSPNLWSHYRNCDIIKRSWNLSGFAATSTNQLTFQLYELGRRKTQTLKFNLLFLTPDNQNELCCHGKSTQKARKCHSAHREVKDALVEPTIDQVPKCTKGKKFFKMSRMRGWFKVHGLFTQPSALKIQICQVGLVAKVNYSNIW